MTETIREQLSALLDGELPDAETELVLKRLERDPALRAQLSRYSLIGSALRGDGAAPSVHSVADRVNAAIAREPAPRRWARPLGGVAVAASVAGLALLMLQRPAMVAQQDAPVVVPAAQVVAAQPAVTLAAPVASVARAAEPAPLLYTTPAAVPAGDGLAPVELVNYVVAHSEYASPLTRRAVVSGLLAGQEPAAARQ